jgi:hypothetical protein
MSKILGESKVPTDNFISGKELLDGIIVEVLKAPQVVSQSEDTPDKYKTGEGNGLVKAGIIKQGETLRYTFLWQGEEAIFENSSYAFYKALYKLSPEAGQKFSIKRTGDGTSTKYSMKFVEGEVEEVENSEDGLNF